jgi:hypothetical protein
MTPRYALQVKELFSVSRSVFVCTDNAKKLLNSKEQCPPLEANNFLAN